MPFYTDSPLPIPLPRQATLKKLYTVIEMLSAHKCKYLESLVQWAADRQHPPLLFSCHASFVLSQQGRAEHRRVLSLVQLDKLDADANLVTALQSCRVFHSLSTVVKLPIVHTSIYSTIYLFSFWQLSCPPLLSTSSTTSFACLVCHHTECSKVVFIFLKSLSLPLYLPFCFVIPPPAFPFFCYSSSFSTWSSFLPLFSSQQSP